MKWGIRNEKRGSTRKERRASNRAFNERNASKRITRTSAEAKALKKSSRISAVVAGLVFLGTRRTMMTTPTRVLFSGGAALATKNILKDRYDKKLSDI
jgi:hypothetical protein